VLHAVAISGIFGHFLNVVIAKQREENIIPLRVVTSWR